MSVDLTIQALLIALVIMYLIWIAKLVKRSLYEDNPGALNFIFTDYRPVQAFGLAVFAVMGFITAIFFVAVVMPGYVVWSCFKRKS
jgi:hypothetical protein